VRWSIERATRPSLCGRPNQLIRPRPAETNKASGHMRHAKRLDRLPCVPTHSRPVRPRPAPMRGFLSASIVGDKRRRAGRSFIVSRYSRGGGVSGVTVMHSKGIIVLALVSLAAVGAMAIYQVVTLSTLP
jgi:hypothetical protein